MSEFKHTPGQWYPSYHGTICVGVQNTPDGFTQMICNSILPETDEEYEKQRDEIEANMKLIASAPEMLDALIGLVRLKSLLEYPNKVHERHVSEAMAVSAALMKIENVIKKVTE
jgi:hypothetical protein